MARREREPEPWEMEWWWHSKPVAKSLHILAELDVLVRELGRTDGTPGFYGFSVEIKVSPLTPAPHLKPGDRPYHAGENFSVYTRRELHAVAQEAQRRAEEAKGEEAP